MKKIFFLLALLISINSLTFGQVTVNSYQHSGGVNTGETTFIDGHALYNNFRFYSMRDDGSSVTQFWNASTMYYRNFTTNFDCNPLSSSNNTGFSIAGVTGFRFTSDGLTMFAVQPYSGTNSLVKYTLSTAFNLGTASYDSHKNLPATSNTNSLFIDSTGTYFAYKSYATVYIMEMSTAFDVTTATTYSTLYIGIGSLSECIEVSDNGQFLYSYYQGSIRKREMTTPFDLSTVSVYEVFDMTAYTGSASFSYPSLNMTQDGLHFMLGTSKTTGSGYRVTTWSNTVPYYINEPL